MDDSPNLWYAVFVDPRGKQFPEDDTYRTVYFDFHRPHTLPEIAREALGKRYPKSPAGRQWYSWGHGAYRPNAAELHTARQHRPLFSRLPPGHPFATFP